MARPDHFLIKNWAKFQHYKDRNPPWIKLHVEILASEDWVTLADASKLLAIVCMIIAARNEGVVPNNPAYIKRVAYLDKLPDLMPLIDCGFLLNPQADASERKRTLANARPEKEAEAEADTSLRDGADAPLKDRIFGPCLDWLAERSGKPKAKLRSVVGKWLAGSGDGATLEAMITAQRNCPQGDPVAYIETLLKPKNPNGKAQQSAKQSTSDHLAGLAHVLGAGSVEDGRTEPDGKGPVIDGDYAVVENAGTGGNEGLRAGNDAADQLRNGVRNPLGEPATGSGDLSGGTGAPAGGPASSSRERGAAELEVGQSPSVPGGYFGTRSGGIPAPQEPVGEGANSPDQSPASGTCGTQHHRAGTLEKASSEHQQNFPDMPDFLKRKRA